MRYSTQDIVHMEIAEKLVRNASVSLFSLLQHLWTT